MKFEHVTLENGLEIVAEIHPAAHSAAVGIFVEAGSRDESDESAGVSHFLEHMAFKGTPTRSADDVNRELDEMGSHSNARTGEERTIYHAAVLPEFTAPVTRLLCDLMRPSLREDDFETEKKVIVEEILMYDDQPPFGGHERLMADYYGNHPLGRSVLGTVESVTALTPESMRRYFRERYSPDNMLISGAGRIDFPAWVDAIREATADWEPSGRGRQVGPAEPHFGTDLLVKPKASQEYVLQLAPAPHATDPERHAARLLATIVGDDSGSRMFWEFVDPGRAEYAGVGNYEFAGNGVALTVICCDPETIGENLERLALLQQTIATGEFSEDELDRACRKTVASLLLQSERPENRMFSVGNNWRVHRTYRTPREVAEKYRRVTLDDIRRVASTWSLDRTRTLLVGPVAEYPTVAPLSRGV